MLFRQALGDMQVPMDSLLLVTAVLSVFMLFAIVVAWVDHSTSRWLRARAAEKNRPAEFEEPRRKAA